MMTPSTKEKTTYLPDRTQLEQKPFVNDRITFMSVLMTILAVLCIILCGFAVSSSKLVDRNAGSIKYDSSETFDSFSSILTSDAVSDIADIPRLYVLPLTDDPAPVPNPDGYDRRKDTPLDYTEPTDVFCYEDETIKVTCWREIYKGDTVNFAEIYIAHPSQFRRAFAGNSYESSARYEPVAIANGVNAVVALNADYCRYRKEGIIYHHGQLLRNVVDNKNPLDLLLYDTDGNFHVCRDLDLENSGILTDHDILYSFAFGPTLVENGVVRTKEEIAGYPLGVTSTLEPRAAIGQLSGERRYLLCTVNGRTKRINFETTDNLEAYEQSGMTTAELAVLMHEKGCTLAYAMDGGQSATLVFNKTTFNTPAYGGQRVVSDVLYFGTAVPNE